MFPLNMFSNDTLRDRTRRAMFCLERVNLVEAKDKFPGEISGGMQKRVAIARAIALNPNTCSAMSLIPAWIPRPRSLLTN